MDPTIEIAVCARPPMTPSASSSFIRSSGYATFRSSSAHLRTAVLCEMTSFERGVSRCRPDSCLQSIHAHKDDRLRAMDNATEMQFGFDRKGEVFCAGRVVQEWSSVEEFKNKPFKVEIVKAGSPRCEELMRYFRGRKRGQPMTGNL